MANRTTSTTTMGIITPIAAFPPVERCPLGDTGAGVCVISMRLVENSVVDVDIPVDAVVAGGRSEALQLSCIIGARTVISERICV